MWGGVVRLYKKTWAYSYTYRAIYIETSLSIYKWALGCYKVHRGLYMGTSLIFLNLALYFSFISSFSILITFLYTFKST